MNSGAGPVPAKIMLVGDVYSWEEERVGEALCGPSGLEFNKMLLEAGIHRSACFTTSLVNARPPGNNIEAWLPTKKSGIKSDFVPLRDRMVHPIVKQGYQQLLREIHEVEPNVIITCGNAPLWALTGAVGALKWRGSLLQMVPDSDLFQTDATLPKVIPVVHPYAVSIQGDLRGITVRDLGRARANSLDRTIIRPAWNFTIRPNFETVMSTLDTLWGKVNEGPTNISLDLETRAGHIACCGLAWSTLDAICIPFMAVNTYEGSYWSLEEETFVINKLYHLLTHKNCLVDWQNGLYDAQYIHRHWHFIPNGVQDTMISHHTAFAGLPKSLDYQASMYCNHYLYWKDDGKTWAKNVGEDQLWSYNCQDAVYTREIAEIQKKMIPSMGLDSVHDFQQAMFYPVLTAMQRGVRIDKKARDIFAGELQEEMAQRERYLTNTLGHDLNPRSSTQMTKLFYTDLAQIPIMSRATKKVPAHVTCNDEALVKIGLREPLLRPIIRAIQEFRSLGVFLSTFVLAPLDVDGRMRCSYNICGTETYRLASSENAFGSGTNLQNVPMGGENDDSDLVLPNVRKLFIPDPGYTMFDTDLSKADLRVVAWESDEGEMKAMLAEGRDPYIEAAREFHRDGSIKKNLPSGMADPRYKQFKAFAHGTHYLQSPNGLAQRQAMTVHAATKLQAWYFGKYPKIKLWQEDFKKAVAARRYVENKFGYRRYYFEKITDDVFREAIAWVPQSTVAIYINKVWMNLYRDAPSIQILLQVHDSLVGQFPTYKSAECLALIDAAARVVVPYNDPLIIPIGVKTSDKSWGACE